MAPSPVGRARPRAARRFAAAMVALLGFPLLLAACGAINVTPEPATPTDFPGLAGRFNAAQVKVRDWVSGDAGCTDPDLVKSAISFTASGLDQVEPVKVYLYIFSSKDAFDRHLGQVGPCATAFVTDAATFEQVAESPYVLVGQGPWAPDFTTAVQQVLEKAAGTGD